MLSTAGIRARASGGGVHWHVDIEPEAPRSLRVHCFWYERAIAALMLGMNPSNARSALRTPPAPYEGPEYFVIVRDGETKVADGRTREAADVVTCARAWLAGGDLEREAPFIDAKGRAMRALARQLDPGLRHEIGEDPSYELWVYGEGRSCKVIASGACSFLIGQAQIALGHVRDLPAAVRTWLVDRVAVGALATAIPEVALERHAEVLEVDPARWHWLHVRDRIADPTDVLAPMRELIEALAESPIARTFYTYSSLDRLCFSASSHYPWVDDDLPVVTPRDGAGVAQIEATLAASPLRPFFGSAPHHELPRLAESLARCGSALRPQVVQRLAWHDLVVTSVDGTRRCKVSDRHVSFLGPTGRVDQSLPTLDDVARAIQRYCEESDRP